MTFRLRLLLTWRSLFTSNFWRQKKTDWESNLNMVNNQIFLVHLFSKIFSDDSFELGSDDEESEGARSKITYKLTMSTENITEQRKTIAQTHI